MRLDEPAQQSGGEEWGVSRENKDLVDLSFQQFPRRAHGVARPERSLLHGHIEPGEEIGGAHRGDDHDPSELELLRRRQHPVHHPPAENRMQVLRQRGVHARPEPRGHDDRSEFVGNSHRAHLLQPGRLTCLFCPVPRKGAPTPVPTWLLEPG